MQGSDLIYIVLPIVIPLVLFIGSFAVPGGQQGRWSWPVT
jgi:hypothetical protein